MRYLPEPKVRLTIGRRHGSFVLRDMNACPGSFGGLLH